MPHSEYALAAYYIIATAEASSNLARYDGVGFGHRAKEGDDIVAMYKNTREAEYIKVKQFISLKIMFSISPKIGKSNKKYTFLSTLI